jgi:malate dehydrogenase (quinone)
MLDVLARGFPDRFGDAPWQRRLRELLPSYGRSLDADAALCAQVRDRARGILRLD